MANNDSTFRVQSLMDEGTLAVNDGYRAKNSELSNEGIPFARAGNIQGGFRFEDADRFPIHALDLVQHKISQPGDVVFTSKGTVGRFAIVSDSTPQFVYSPQLCFWRSLDHARLLPRWLYYWMQGREFFEQYRGVAGQTDMAEYVSLRDQRSMRITIPPIRQQKYIADSLGSLDDKVELNRQMKETLEAIARRLFKSWFIDFDPVHAKAAVRRQYPGWPSDRVSRAALPKLGPAIAEIFPDGFEESELGPIPKGWRTRPLYDIANFVNGAAFKNSDFCDSAIGKPVVKIAELKSGVSSQTKHSQKDVGADREIQRGDTLYSWSGSPDTSLATFRWTGRDGLLNQHIFKVITGNRPDEIFAYYQLNDLRDTLVEIARNKQTTGLGHVTVADMKRLHVIQPALVVLETFADSIGPTYDQSFNLSVDSLTLEQTRDKLLPRLLSGLLTVNSEVA